MNIKLNLTTTEMLAMKITLRTLSKIPIMKHMEYISSDRTETIISQQGITATKRNLEKFLESDNWEVIF